MAIFNSKLLVYQRVHFYTLICPWGYQPQKQDGDLKKKWKKSIHGWYPHFGSIHMGIDVRPSEVMGFVMRLWRFVRPL